MGEQVNLPGRYSADLVFRPGMVFSPGHCRWAWSSSPPRGAAVTGTAGEHVMVPGGASAADADGGLGFPNMPRLELDELLEQLVERAGDVLAAQGRLRGLLRANALVAGDLSLPVVLRQIVGSARDLLGARSAALGVLGPDGELEQFVHDGMDDALMAQIGDLPRGRGVLGLLTSEPVPVRLADLSAHPAAAGSPQGHPPTGSFVSVPVSIGEEVFGNLYLTERTAGGEFTADDEELAFALAAAAGAAIANARRFAESEQRRRWLDASTQLTPLLLAEGQERPHALITGHATAATDADFALLALPREPDQVIVAGATGPLAAGLANRMAPLAGSLAGQAIQVGKPELITGDRLEAAAAALGAGIGPLIVVPLAAGERVLGALMLGRLAVRPGFTETDLERPLLRRPRRRGHGARPGPHRPDPAGPGGRPRPHRGRPARPRHPGTVRARHEAAGHAARSDPAPRSGSPATSIP